MATLRYIWDQYASPLMLLLLLAAVGVGIVGGVVLGRVRVRRGKAPLSRGTYLVGVLLWLWLVGMVFVTLLGSRGIWGSGEVNLQLFLAWEEAWYAGDRTAWLYIVLNLALFLPLGVLLPLLETRFQKVTGVLGTAAVLTLVLVFALPGLDVKNLLPVTAADAPGVARSALTVFGAGAAVLFFAAFAGGATPETPGRARCAMRWCVRTCVLVTLLSVFTIGNLGAGLTAQLNHPFFTLLRNISLFHAVERFGALVIGLWVLPDFVLVAMLLTLAVNCLRAACTRNAQLFARKNPPALVLLCAAAVGAGALLLAQNAFDTDALQTNVVPRLNLALLGLGTVGTYLTGRARKTI